MLFRIPSTKTISEICDWNALCSTATFTEQRMVEGLLQEGAALPAYGSQQLAFCTVTELRKHFEASRTEINLSSVLYMVAATEARIRFDATSRVNGGSSDPLGTALRNLYTARQTAWSVPLRDNGILEAWKTYARMHLTPSDQVDVCVISLGNWATALDIRHWVAHGRYWQLTRQITGSMVADIARATEAMVGSLQALARIGGLRPFV